MWGSRTVHRHGDEGAAVEGIKNSTMLILAALSDQHGPVTVAELAELTGLHKASLYRSVESLVDEGLVDQVPGNPRRYTVGIDFIRIGIRAVRHFEMRSILLPVLVQLAHEIDETCFLVFYTRKGLVLTDSIYRSEGPVFPVAEGGRFPCHVTAGGKVTLAFQSVEEIDRVLGLPLQRFTENTIVDPGELREELDRIRQRGYATAWADRQPNYGSLGVPILDRSGFAVAALSVGLRAEDTPHDPILKAALPLAHRASSSLGYLPRWG